GPHRPAGHPSGAEPAARAVPAAVPRASGRPAGSRRVSRGGGPARRRRRRFQCRNILYRRSRLLDRTVHRMPIDTATERRYGGGGSESASTPCPHGREGCTGSAKGGSDLLSLGATARALPSLSRAEFVYTTVRDAILSNKFRPGERLSEERIGQQLQVSRTPVREALKRLHAEGLVEITPHRGAVVRDPCG